MQLQKSVSDTKDLRMAAEIERELAGTWILENSENVDAYLTELGFGECERKSVADGKTVQTIRVADDVIQLDMSYGRRQMKIEFKLHEDFEIKAGKCSKCTAFWNDGALVVHCRRIDSGRLQVIERRRVGDKLVQLAMSFGTGLISESDDDVEWRLV